ncbi:TPA: hypothetical protein RQN22_001809 [Aeromonas dhakensis]|nr:hypothetical protein [Aeromonas dhakensis]
MANIKKENMKYVAAVISLPLVISIIISYGLVPTKEMSLITSEIGISFVLICALVMISSILPQEIKHKIVFLKMRDELPGCRCHLLIKNDVRIDQADVIKYWPLLLDEKVDGKARNSSWYKEVYRCVRDTPQVESAHESFLLYRDSAAGLLISSFFLACLYFLPKLGFPVPVEIEIVFIVTNLIVLIMAIVCAQSAGKRMVTNAVVEALNQRLPRIETA